MGRVLTSARAFNCTRSVFFLFINHTCPGLIIVGENTPHALWCPYYCYYDNKDNEIIIIMITRVVITIRTCYNFNAITQIGSGRFRSLSLICFTFIPVKERCVDNGSDDTICYGCMHATRWRPHPLTDRDLLQRYRRLTESVDPLKIHVDD